MQRHRHILARLLIACAVAVVPTFARAATVTWDANGTGASVTDGAGAWLGANQWWNGSNLGWTSGDDAVFGVSGTGGAVTLSAPTTANSMTFNTYSGTYSLGTAGQLLTIGSGGITMNSTAGAVTLNSPVAIDANQIWQVDTTGTTRILTTGTTLSGAGNLTKRGTGVLRLSATNTFTGTNAVEGGTLWFNNQSLTNSTLLLSANTTGSSVATSTGAGARIDIGALGGAGNLILQRFDSGVYVGGNNASTTFSGTMSTSSNLTLLYKVGTGTMTFDGTGPQVSGFATTGTAFTIDAGAVRLRNGDALANANTRIMASGQGLVFDASVTSGTFTVAGLGGGSSPASLASTGPLNLANNLGGAITLVVNNSALSLFSGTLSGPGNIVKTGAGELRMSAATGSITGTVRIQSGTVAPSATNLALATVVLDGGALGVFANNDVTIGALAGSGTRAAGSNSGLTFGGNNASTTFAGTLTGAPTSGRPWIKAGTGTFTFTGTNSFTTAGEWTVSGGVVLATTLAASGSNVWILQSGGALATGYALDQAVVNRITTASAGAVALGSNSSENLTFVLPDLTALSLGAASGTWAYTGTLTPNGSTYRLGGGGGTLNFDSDLVDAGGTSRSLVVGGNTAGLGGTVILPKATNSFTGQTTVQMGVLEIASLNDAGSNSPLGTANTINLSSGTSVGTLRYAGSGSSTSNRTIQLSGSTGGGTIDASGAGPLILTGSIGAAAGSKTLTLTGSSTQANSIGFIANPSSGSVSVIKDGPGRWRLTGTNSFDGLLTVKNGTLVAAADANAVGSSGAFGWQSPVVGDTTAGATGTAALLVAAGFSVGRDVNVASGAGVNQAVLIGGASSTGTASFDSGMNLNLGRDVALVATGGGVVNFANGWNWAGAGNATPSVNVAIGAQGYTGTVRLDKSGGALATTGSVSVRYGAAVLGVNTVIDGAGTLVIDSPATLGGIGTVAGPLGGAGLVAPGNSPGILTAEAVDPTGGLDWAFEFTGAAPDYGNAAASINDVLRLTGTAPLTTGLTAGNVVNLYFSGSAAGNVGDVYQGGFFTDSTAGAFANFQSLVSSGTFVAYYQSGTGSHTYNGQTYALLSDLGRQVQVGVATVPSAGFNAGASTVTNGQVTTFTVVVPEPAAIALAGIGIAAAAWAARRRRLPL